MKEEEKPVILVSNDDGITAPGIEALVQVASELGKVVVVAPDSPQSGMGHAVTIGKPLRLDKVELFEGIESYQCSGTPADCVKVAVDQVLYRKPDMVVSGINHGSNASINVLYSGTMSAAMEGGIEGVPSVGFSLTDYSMKADFEASKTYARLICKNVLEKGLPDGVVLNVNIPKAKAEHIQGIKVCRQANAKWEENFTMQEDPNGRPFYWLTGKFQDHDHGDDTDLWALSNGYVSVVPVEFDLTAYHSMSTLNQWDLDEQEV